MLTLSLILLLAALVGTLLSAMGKCPLWVPLLLVVIVLLIDRIPWK